MNMLPFGDGAAQHSVMTSVKLPPGLYDIYDIYELYYAHSMDIERGATKTLLIRISSVLWMLLDMWKHVMCNVCCGPGAL